MWSSAYGYQNGCDAAEHDLRASTLFWSRRVRPWLRGLVGVVLIGVALLGASLGWLKWRENELVFETALSHTRHYGPLPSYAEPLTIPGADGAALAAVIMRADPAHDSGFWVLHLHGNADSAFSAPQLRHCERLEALGLNVLAFDYRGFGQSPGLASEGHLYEDAAAAYQELIRRGIRAKRIILWGHSLGSGPAVELAIKHSAAALVLFGAFTSIPDAAADAYPYLPVRWIVGVHMDSLKRIPNVHIPVIIAHSISDKVIAFREGARLYAAANEPKEFLSLAAAATDGLGGHANALYDHLELLAPRLTELTGAHLWP